jgi:hypothetical protein
LSGRWFSSFIHLLCFYSFCIALGSGRSRSFLPHIFWHSLRSLSRMCYCLSFDTTRPHAGYGTCTFTGTGTTTTNHITFILQRGRKERKGDNRHGRRHAEDESREDTKYIDG